VVDINLYAVNHQLEDPSVFWRSHYSWGILKNVKHCLDFSFVFSAPLPAARNLFSRSQIFFGGRYQPGYTGIF
jgi:hypothetical protein